ncbi:hypothetical protein TR631_12665 [Streptomyces rochei]|uniref:hypothetical protein n=1 Tax=Streptomyces rochei TaxID=1928 RepID=UPI002ACDE118|nr:hypothetical protein [Streptomyces rochei]WQC12621.1 hypothetical protein TR631_12665 [Streptomyces rochei]
MSAVPESAARLSPEREAETRKHIAELIYPTYGQRDTERTLAIADAVMPAVRAALLAELAAVRTERDQARERALREAADHFVRMADREPDPHGYRARVMRGAANDIRRLIEEPVR